MPTIVQNVREMRKPKRDLMTRIRSDLLLDDDLDTPVPRTSLAGTVVRDWLGRGPPARRDEVGRDAGCREDPGDRGGARLAQPLVRLERVRALDRDAVGMADDGDAAHELDVLDDDAGDRGDEGVVDGIHVGLGRPEDLG